MQQTDSGVTASITARGAGYHCVASLWEIAGTQQLEGKERSRGSAESKPPLIKTLRLTLPHLALTLSHSHMEMNSHSLLTAHKFRSLIVKRKDTQICSNAQDCSVRLHTDARSVFDKHKCTCTLLRRLSEAEGRGLTENSSCLQ